MKNRPIYPFTAIVGQEKMKLALMLNVVNPSLSGVLIRGEKGTAKSTAVRALADILPEITVFAEDPFHLDPEEEPASAEAPVPAEAGAGPGDALTGGSR